MNELINYQVSRVRAIKGAHVLWEGVAILATVLVGKIHHSFGSFQKLGAVAGVDFPKDDGSCGQGGGRLAGHVRARFAWGHAVGSPVGVHVLGPLPALVVSLFGPGVGALKEVVGGPADGNSCGDQLGAQALAVVDDAPGEHGGGEGHGEVEFDVVPRVVISAHQSGIASPGEVLMHALEAAGPLPLEEQKGFLQGATVVVGPVHG
ncbi:GTPase Der [Striga asiatica]|uniref:GTPase Der n=1 Tax=Striga asiatica TaxID=4170 RepID=A0A5A7P4P9_STRAF|nr:GTPase Der [Striga asiatica]